MPQYSPNEVRKFARRFWSQVDMTGSCWFWIGEARRGSLDYGAIKLPVALRARPKAKMESTHRVAFFLISGYWPELARHTCDVPLCCRPAHVIEGTQADNMHDMAERGRRRCRTVKYGPEIWAAIRRSDASSTVLGLRYGIHPAHVRNIKQGKTGIITDVEIISR